MPALPSELSPAAMHILRVMPVAGATDGLINEALTLREAWPK